MIEVWASGWKYHLDPGSCARDVSTRWTDAKPGLGCGMVWEARTQLAAHDGGRKARLKYTIERAVTRTASAVANTPRPTRP